jgi:hypothetical protein
VTITIPKDQSDDERAASILSLAVTGVARDSILAGPIATVNMVIEIEREERKEQTSK